MCGCLSLYMALFLYEDEEKLLDEKFVNILNKLWIELDDVSKKAVAKNTLFMQRTAEVVSVGFDYLFGKRLLSRRVLTLSLCYSNISAGLVAVMADRLFLSDVSLRESLLAGVYAALFFGLALLTILRPQHLKAVFLSATFLAIAPYLIQAAAALYVQLLDDGPKGGTLGVYD